MTRAGWEALREAGERIWLFWPTSQQARKGPVRAYLRLRTSDGGCNREAFKVRSRRPWYRTPLSSGIDGYMSGMSTHGPWVVFRDAMRRVASKSLMTLAALRGQTAERRRRRP